MIRLRTKKSKGTTVKVVEEIVEKVEVPLKEKISIEKLENLYITKNVRSLELSTKDITEHARTSLKIMQAIESVGLDPIEINSKWYTYAITGDWLSESIMAPNQLIRFQYAYPIPKFVQENMQKVLKVVGLPNKDRTTKHCSAYIYSASPVLGYSPDIDRRPATILADPIMAVHVYVLGNSYTYEVGTWDLSIDLDNLPE